jgi:hypothetical protein
MCYLQGRLQIGSGGLDRERRPLYDLRIVATDSGGHRAVQVSNGAFN